jgi:hypothetical protein
VDPDVDGESGEVVDDDGRDDTDHERQTDDRARHARDGQLRQLGPEHEGRDQVRGRRDEIPRSVGCHEGPEQATSTELKRRHPLQGGDGEEQAGEDDEGQAGAHAGNRVSICFVTVVAPYKS